MVFPERCGVVRRAHPGDVGRVLVVTVAGWVASLRRSRAGGVLVVLTLALAVVGPVSLGLGVGVVVTLGWLVFAVLGVPLLAAVLVVWPSAGTVGYLLPGGPGEPAVVAVLGLRRRGDGSWLVENHDARRVGRGWGARLRAEAGPGIAAALDADGAVLRLVAAGPRLAARYREGFVDGLEPAPSSIVDRLLGRVTLERRPRPGLAGDALAVG